MQTEHNNLKISNFLLHLAQVRQPGSLIHDLRERAGYFLSMAFLPLLGRNRVLRDGGLMPGPELHAALVAGPAGVDAGLIAYGPVKK